MSPQSAHYWESSCRASGGQAWSPPSCLSLTFHLFFLTSPSPLPPKLPLFNLIAPFLEPRTLLPPLIITHPDWLMFPDRSCVRLVVTQLAAARTMPSPAAVCSGFSSPRGGPRKSGDLEGGGRLGENSPTELHTATSLLTLFFSPFQTRGHLVIAAH